MDNRELIQLISDQFKLVRTEFNYTQDKMATILGLSKKTLVQIEKGRQTASWVHIVALCTIFQNSSILQNALGGDPIEVVQTIAHKHYDWRKPKTLGGKVWWIERDRKNGFILQQNIISQHYRILDDEYHRWFSSFDKEFIYRQFESLTGNKKAED